MTWGDCEHEDQVEEKLERGDLVLGTVLRLAVCRIHKDDLAVGVAMILRAVVGVDGVVHTRCLR